MTALPGYDNWKLQSGYESDGPEPQAEPGPCQRCDGTGVIAVSSHSGRYLCAGPVPEDARRVRDAWCDACGGSGTIAADEDDAEDR